MKQETQDLKSGFESSINQVKASIDAKFSELIYNWNTLKKVFPAQKII